MALTGQNMVDELLDGTQAHRQVHGHGCNCEERLCHARPSTMSGL